MKRKLLLRAAEVLKKIPKEQFDLDHWIRGDARNCIINGEKITKQARCGTIACAGGWLGLTKEFNDIGLRFVKHSSDAAANLVFLDNHQLITGDPIQALQHTFGLTYDQADALFTSSGDGDYDEAIYEKYGYDLHDRDLFQYRVKKVINAAKSQKGRK